MLYRNYGNITLQTVLKYLAVIKFFEKKDRDKKLIEN